MISSFDPTTIAMSPTQFQAKREEDKCPPPLKINKASHFVKKSPSSPSSTAISSTVNGISSSTRPLQRQPVIIYTHSPKVIHTNPRDFMALVQKLTGLSRSDDDSLLLPSTSESVIQTEKNKRVMISGGGGEDNESSSGVTEENWYCLGNNINGCVDSSCMAPQVLEPPIDYMNNIPIFSSNLTDFLCSNQTYYNYSDSMLFNSFNTRNSSTFDGPNMNQLH